MAFLFLPLGLEICSAAQLLCPQIGEPSRAVVAPAEAKSPLVSGYQAHSSKGEPNYGGVVVNGKVADVTYYRGKPAYVRFSGPVRLLEYSVRKQGYYEIPGQGFEQHKSGYSTPVGRLKNGEVLADMTSLQLMNLIRDHTDDTGMVTLRYESGIEVRGFLKSLTISESAPDRVTVISFSRCRVMLHNLSPGGDSAIELFSPDWGDFDLLNVLGLNLTPAEFNPSSIIPH